MSARPGRNDACPCGSGAKYKKCCAMRPATTASRATSSGPRDRASELHTLDRDLVERMLAFADRIDDWAPEDDFPVRLSEVPEAAMLLRPWAVYEYAPGDVTVRERFVRARRFELRASEIAWLEAQSRSWLTAWEVLSVVPGASVVVRDLFTGEQREVIEKSGSECLTSRDVLLARVVDHEGLSLFCGMHPLPLGPRDGAAFLEIARKTLGGRRNARLTMADLRTPGVATLLIAAWDDVCEMVDERPPPVLHNTDGELLVLVRDELAVTGALAGVRERLLRLPGATADEPDDDAREEAVAFVRQNPPGSSLENTVVGRALLAETTLVLETNSRERAAKLRKDVERACAGMVQYVSRTERDGAELTRQSQSAGAAAAAAPRRPRSPASAAPPELRATLRQMKTEQYRRWCDLTIPALGGMTPREAASSTSKRVRDELALILKEIERGESRAPSDEAFDVDVIRRELGLADTRPKRGPGRAGEAAARR
jgi:hypothetical protein